MNKNFEIILKYFNEENVEYTYDEDKEFISIVVGKSNSGKKIFEDLIDDGPVLRVYISMKFGQNIRIDKNTKHRLLEYFHQVNFGMIRGNFEYDSEMKLFRFKNYFESEMISNKNYVMYNIVLPVIMFKKYLLGVKDVIKTNKSVKSIINKIESEST